MQLYAVNNFVDNSIKKNVKPYFRKDVAYVNNFLKPPKPLKTTI